MVKRQRLSIVFFVVFSLTSILGSKLVYSDQAWMELRIPDRIQSKLPYAFLSRPSAISTPSYVICAKNHFLHDEAIHCKAAYKICHREKRKVFCFCSFWLIIPVYGEYGAWGRGIVAQTVYSPPYIKALYIVRKVPAGIDYYRSVFCGK